MPEKFDIYSKIFCRDVSIPVCFGPASPDAGVELLRQLFLQCILHDIFYSVSKGAYIFSYWPNGDQKIFAKAKFLNLCCKVHDSISFL